MAVFPLQTYVCWRRKAKKTAYGNLGWRSAITRFTAEKYTKQFGVFCFNKPSEAGIFTSAFKLALHLLCCMRTACVCIYYPHDECQKRQNANSSCSQLKWTGRRVRGLWSSRAPCSVPLEPWSVPSAAEWLAHIPHPSKSQSKHSTLWEPASPGITRDLVCQVLLGGSADPSTAEMWDHFWARQSQTMSAPHLLECIALGEKSCKKPACTETKQNQAA